MISDFEETSEYWDLKISISFYCNHKSQEISNIKCDINGKKCIPSIECVDINNELLKNKHVKKYFKKVNIILRGNKLKNLLDNINNGNK